ncbi:unnamed protein product [Heligmosomoides polygyrus]|uniref:Uncharacterized protein n=1 Tax=Heligmosomoides polygyrus TaxID=6339 RepID=A0A3P8DRE1_HELPZ|nr:unnamed protein product [Heligmosomoides polygyrus]
MARRRTIAFWQIVRAMVLGSDPIESEFARNEDNSLGSPEDRAAADLVPPTCQTGFAYSLPLRRLRKAACGEGLRCCDVLTFGNWNATRLIVLAQDCAVCLTSGRNLKSEAHEGQHMPFRARALSSLAIGATTGYSDRVVVPTNVGQYRPPAWLTPVSAERGSHPSASLSPESLINEFRSGIRATAASDHSHMSQSEEAFIKTTVVMEKGTSTSHLLFDQMIFFRRTRGLTHGAGGHASLSSYQKGEMKKYEK